jgi:hypothetical protein
LARRQVHAIRKRKLLFANQQDVAVLALSYHGIDSFSCAETQDPRLFGFHADTGRGALDVDGVRSGHHIDAFRTEHTASLFSRPQASKA